MDTSHVSINELFARAQESFERYKNNERSNSKRPPTRRQPATATATTHGNTGTVNLARPAKEETAPSYDRFRTAPNRVCAPDAAKSSLVRSQVLSSVGSDSMSIGRLSSPSPLTGQDDTMNYEGPISVSSFSIDDHGWIPNQTRLDKEEETKRRSAYDALRKYLNSGCSEPKEEKPPAPSSEISAMEMRRREAVASSLRACHSKLACAKPRNFKPLSWDKPSFQSSTSKPNADGSNGDSSSSSRLITGKRKESSISAVEPPIGSYRGLGTTMPQERSNPCYGYQHEWSKEEVASFVEFADKWITPDMKRQKR